MGVAAGIRPEKGDEPSKLQSILSPDPSELPDDFNMPIWDHLEELRERCVRSAAGMQNDRMSLVMVSYHKLWDDCTNSVLLCEPRVSGTITMSLVVLLIAQDMERWH